MIETHTLVRPSGLLRCDVVLDVGAGIRPMNWYRPRRHVCVEPYGPYCKALRAAGYSVLEMTAEEALLTNPPGIDAVYLLDVIEHMDKAAAWRTIFLACDVAVRQVVIFTPYGFMEQTEDAWGMGGECWQTHRSGWFPEEFPDGWDITLYRPRRRKPVKAFFAIWNNEKRSVDGDHLGNRQSWDAGQTVGDGVEGGRARSMGM